MNKKLVASIGATTVLTAAAFLGDAESLYNREQWAFFGWIVCYVLGLHYVYSYITKSDMYAGPITVDRDGN